MELLNTIPAGMKDGLMEAAAIVRKHGKVHLMSHYDADGISAAAIVRTALDRAGIATECTIFKTLGPSELAEALSAEAECVVMTDIGTSFLRELSEKEWDIVILDHHKIAEGYVVPEREGFAFSSPLLFGIDGSKNVCGSAMAYLFALALDPANEDLVALAVSGMFGDKQNLGGFESIDKQIVDDAVEKGLLKVIRNLAYPSSLTFNDAMMSCYEPYFRDFTGVQDKVNRFIKSCGLMPYDTPAAVSQEKIDLFAEAVRQRMVRDRVPKETQMNAFGVRYYSPGFDIDVSELAGILDGCGRDGNYSEAFEACTTREYTEARIIAGAYTQKVLEAVEPAFASLVPMDNIQYFERNEGGLNGNIAGVLIRYLADPEKPVVGLAPNGNGIEISSRGSNHLVEKGLNLSEALRDCCAAVGGQGGGHIIASGGSLPDAASKERFLELLDEHIGRQFEAKMKK